MILAFLGIGILLAGLGIILYYLIDSEVMSIVVAGVGVFCYHIIRYI